MKRFSLTLLFILGIFYAAAQGMDDQNRQLPASVSADTASQTVSNSGTEDLTFTVGGVRFKMIKVSGGIFRMGATAEQGDDADSDEKPVHSVTLSDYWIGEFEVTQELWQAVMGRNPSYFKGGNLPVEQVSWDDITDGFLPELNRMFSSQLGGKRFCLPTEAQWEYAARGGSKSLGHKYAGRNMIEQVAWYSSNSDGKTHPVGQKQPNELGLYDMSGNVYEWCSDWYTDYSYGSSTNPTGASSGSNRVLRGGSWYGYAGRCRVSYRSYSYPSSRGDFIGFRLALR